MMPFVSSETTIYAACVATGCMAMLEIVRKVNEPVTKETLAFSDVSTKLAYKGYKTTAIRIHIQAVWSAFAFILVLAVILLSLALLGSNALEGLTMLLKPCMGWILGIITLVIVTKSSRPYRTALIIALSICLGYWTFHNPELKNSSWVMAPLLGGLFMVGPSLSLMLQGKALAHPEEKTNNWEVDSDVELKGALAGCVAGFLAGVGTSSLVALLALPEEEDYLALQTAADASNNFFAILGFVLIGSTRSGTVAAIAATGAAVSPYDGALYLSLILAGMLVGQRLIKGLVLLPTTNKLTPIVLIGTITLVIKSTGFTGLLVMGAAWQLSILAKSWKVPNQALLTTMMGPVMLYYLIGI
jgi:TctA family transporter